MFYLKVHTGLCIFGEAKAPLWHAKAMKAQRGVMARRLLPHKQRLERRRCASPHWRLSPLTPWQFSTNFHRIQVIRIHSRGRVQQQLGQVWNQPGLFHHLRTSGHFWPIILWIKHPSLSRFDDYQSCAQTPAVRHPLTHGIVMQMRLPSPASPSAAPSQQTPSHQHAERKVFSWSMSISFPQAV